MTKAFLNRVYLSEDRTLGYFTLYSCLSRIFECKTLEPPWKNNQHNISCIPPGDYFLIPRNSEKFGDHLEVYGVPGRELILVHCGCWPKNTEGCILVGQNFVDFDGDGEKEINRSRDTFKVLMKLAISDSIPFCISGR